ncbi:hypothetical protein OBBRIDRAFT_740952, partial [Obba rivulosa]
LHILSKVFDKLVKCLNTCRIFHLEFLYCSQLGISEQLAIFLKCARHYRNDIANIAEWAGVATKMVINIISHIQIVLLSKHNEAVCWPTDNRYGYLAVNSTAIMLYQKPALYRDMWYNKNYIYVMELQIVIILDSLQIVHHVVGHIENVHDLSVFLNTIICQEHNTCIHLFD